MIFLLSIKSRFLDDHCSYCYSFCCNLYYCSSCCCSCGGSCCLLPLSFSHYCSSHCCCESCTFYCCSCYCTFCCCCSCWKSCYRCCFQMFRNQLFWCILLHFLQCLNRKKYCPRKIFLGYKKEWCLPLFASSPFPFQTWLLKDQTLPLWFDLSCFVLLGWMCFS